MEKAEFRNAVIEGIKRVKGVDEVALADGDDFSVAGLDSLDAMNLVLEVEAITGLNFGEFDLKNANSIDQFHAVAEQLSGQA
jgi:acyl carrier protein